MGAKLKEFPLKCPDLSSLYPTSTRIEERKHEKQMFGANSWRETVKVAAITQATWLLLTYFSLVCKLQTGLYWERVFIERNI